MKVLGITGGVGAGKSTILTYLQKRYGACVILADEVGHMVQEPGESCYQKIVEQFGAQILCEETLKLDHTDQREMEERAGAKIQRPIDRQKLGALVYTDRKALEKLNQLVHPAVKAFIVAKIECERQKKEVPFVVVEAALLLEDGYDQICDEIWYVYADEAVRSLRLSKSRGYSAEKTENIMRNQMKDTEFRRRCDFVIDNSGDFVENTYEQIDEGLVRHGFL